MFIAAALGVSTIAALTGSAVSSATANKARTAHGDKPLPYRPPVMLNKPVEIPNSDIWLIGVIFLIGLFL